MKAGLPFRVYIILAMYWAARMHSQHGVRSYLFVLICFASLAQLSTPPLNSYDSKLGLASTKPDPASIEHCPSSSAFEPYVKDFKFFAIVV